MLCDRRDRQALQCFVQFVLFQLQNEYDENAATEAVLVANAGQKGSPQSKEVSEKGRWMKVSITQESPFLAYAF